MDNLLILLQWIFTSVKILISLVEHGCESIARPDYKTLWDHHKPCQSSGNTIIYYVLHLWEKLRPRVCHTFENRMRSVLRSHWSVTRSQIRVLRRKAADHYLGRAEDKIALRGRWAPYITKTKKKHLPTPLYTCCMNIANMVCSLVLGLALCLCCMDVPDMQRSVVQRQCPVLF